jgi:membrane fusion protein (multidrug efflux system)
MPSRAAAIGPEQPGVITEMPKTEGTPVAKGDVLFRLSAEIEALEVERLEALVASTLLVDRAKKKLEHAAREETRVRQLSQENVASDADLQKRELETAFARNEYQQAKLDHLILVNKLEQAKVRLAQRTVRSPFSGRVVAWIRSPGEPAMKLEPVIEVATLDPLWVEFECPIRDQRLFRLGGRVLVAPASQPDESRKATIEFVSVRATPSSHTFRVRLTTPNPDRDWKAGLKMTIRPDPASAKPDGK